MVLWGVQNEQQHQALLRQAGAPMLAALARLSCGVGFGARVHVRHLWAYPAQLSALIALPPCFEEGGAACVGHLAAVA